VHMFDKRGRGSDWLGDHDAMNTCAARQSPVIELHSACRSQAAPKPARSTSAPDLAGTRPIMPGDIGPCAFFALLPLRDRNRETVHSILQATTLYQQS